MVSKVKQASNKHKLVAERAGLVKHQMAIASAAQDELKLRNRSLLECQQINGALNRQLSRERAQHKEDIEIMHEACTHIEADLRVAYAEVKSQRKWLYFYMFSSTVFCVSEYGPKLYNYIAGLL